MYKSFQLSALPLRRQEKIYVEPNTGCWLWIGSWSAKGYGQVQIRSKRRGPHEVHKVIYEFFCGPVATGFDLHHRCQTRCCVNPDHLQVLTHSEHVRLTRSLEPRPTHCRRGHPFDAENTSITTTGAYQCKICRRMAENKRWRLLHPRGRSRPDRTHCEKGHVVTPESTYIWRGHRYCRVCRILSQQKLKK
jgi:HNH endonuclease